MATFNLAEQSRLIEMDRSPGPLISSEGWYTI